jgi:hypothetical protein
MADFEPRTWVVARDTPTLLGVGQVIETPGYSAARLTWAEFHRNSDKRVISAFEPGELMSFSEWVASHNHHKPQVGRIFLKTVMPEIEMPCTHMGGIPAQRRTPISLERLQEMISQEQFTETQRIGRSRNEQARCEAGL